MHPDFEGQSHLLLDRVSMNCVRQEVGVKRKHNNNTHKTLQQAGTERKIGQHDDEILPRPLCWLKESVPDQLLVSTNTAQCGDGDSDLSSSSDLDQCQNGDDLMNRMNE